MRFYIKKITLWFNNGSEPRTLEFRVNKINVITGEKSKGKSSLISIIDYCLLATNSRIVEEVINENVSWYGLDFCINGKDFLVIRKQPNKHYGSDQLYFSSTAEYPEVIKANIDVKKLKTILENEFGIDETITVPYGGKKIRVGSKISFRYFLLFNTLSEDVIASANVFFDYELYDREKYVEALDRIFFLALGVDDVNNVLVKEQLDSLEGELDKIEKKRKQIGRQERLFNDDIIKLAFRAQEFDLIVRKLLNFDEAFAALTNLVERFASPTYSNNLKKLDDLNKEKRAIWKRIRNLERFNEEFDEYKKNLALEHDSLQPITYLKENFEELIPTLEVKTFINTLEESLKEIKKEIASKKSISVNAKAEVVELRTKLSALEREIANLPTGNKEFTDEAQKFIFIGELKSQLSFYKDKWNVVEELPNEDLIKAQIKELKQKLNDTAEQRKVVLRLLEEAIQKHFDRTSSMGVYQDYKVYFDVSKKVLKLRKSDELLSRNVIGSKSNYMFLHLCLFLGMHEHFLSKSKQFVPQFLILDQPSQPYLENSSMDPDTGEINSDDDRNTIKDAFSLLNNFMSNVSSLYNDEFQMILLEHASKDYWESPSLDHFHLVEEFRNGNALIPDRALNNNSDKKITS